MEKFEEFQPKTIFLAHLLFFGLFSFWSFSLAKGCAGPIYIEFYNNRYGELLKMLIVNIALFVKVAELLAPLGVGSEPSIKKEECSFMVVPSLEFKLACTAFSAHSLVFFQSLNVIANAF